MVSSTEIPNAMLNTKMVEGLIGIWKKPITPAVTNRGMKFGINEATTMRHERNKIAMRIDMIMMAKNKLVNRFFTKYCVPSAATTEVPVSLKL